MIKSLSELYVCRNAWKKESAHNKASTWPLDLRLVQFSRYPEDFWTVADACQGVLILGENGSGKTSASGRLFARKYLQAGFGGLVLCFKTDEADLWRQYLKGAGREADGRFFGNEDFRFNFLQSSGRYLAWEPRYQNFPPPG
jgi:hypothetical protein